jgi:hypothetical protein
MFPNSASAGTYTDMGQWHSVRGLAGLHDRSEPLTAEDSPLPLLPVPWIVIYTDGDHTVEATYSGADDSLTEGAIIEAGAEGWSEPTVTVRAVLKHPNETAGRVLAKITNGRPRRSKPRIQR